MSCVVAAQTISRAGMLPLIWTVPYARATEDAKVSPLTGSATPKALAVVGITLVAVLSPTTILIWAAVSGLLAAMLVCLLMRQLVQAKLGGWTGDTAGATQIICEIAFLLGVCAWI